MANIRPVDVVKKENIVPLEESLKIVESTSYIREEELIALRRKVSVLDRERKRLSSEYKRFLLDNNLVPDNVDIDSLVPYNQVSDFFEYPEHYGDNFVDQESVLVPNPTYSPLSVALQEIDELLGPLGKRITWYQNELYKKHSLYLQISKRIEDIESRENNL